MLEDKGLYCVREVNESDQALAVDHMNAVRYIFLRPILRSDTNKKRASSTQCMLVREYSNNDHSFFSSVGFSHLTSPLFGSVRHLPLFSFFSLCVDLYICIYVRENKKRREVDRP